MTKNSYQLASDTLPRSTPIKVGLIGATTTRGWAAMAHVPAIRAIPDFTLHAVATRSDSSARAAAEAFGVPLWFGSASELIAHEEVEAVVIAVKAPDHYALVQQALRAGKPVYCEWPFGHTIEEARQLDALAREKKVTTAVGLQGRFSPWLRQARDILASGRLGRVLSTSLLAYDELSLGSIDQGNAYLLDIKNGANPLTIQTGHYIDALCFVLGELKTVSAMTSISRPRVIIRQTGESVIQTSPDQIAVSGLTESGAMVSFHMRAGTGDPSFLWEIQGERSTLRISSQGYLMWRPLKLELWDPQSKQWVPVPPYTNEEWADLTISPGPAQYIAYLYAAFAQDILTGTTRSVSFAKARQRRETVEAIRLSAIEGAAKTVSLLS